MQQNFATPSMTAFRVIYQALLDSKDRPMVERRGRWYTGRDILDRVYARSLDLKSVCVKPGSTALIVVSDNLLAIEQLLACWFHGAGVAFIDFRTPPARILETAARLSADVIIGMKEIDGISQHIQVENPDPIAFPNDELSEYPDNIAIYMSSSGTTGAPRFTPTIQSKLATNMDITNKARDWDSFGAALSPLSVGYSASSFLWLTRLSVGEPIVAMDLVHRLSELDYNLRRADVSEAGLAPSQLRQLLEMESTADQNTVLRYPQLTNLCSVGGPASTQEKLGAVTRLSESYRMVYSAVGIGKIARVMGDEIKRKPASVGRPEAHLTVKVFDSMRECDIGEIGEISITSETFEDMRPGDMGYFDEDGYLYITGRVQGLLCRHGVNFNAQRLVQAALQHAAVPNAEVVSKPDADQGDIVFLVIEGKGSQIEDVWRTIRKKLPVTEQPDNIVAVDAIPMTTSMKNDLTALKAMILEDGDDA
jgi:acyl-CoA synthetase (AMP-forming)/AMP-acid ligase II